MHISTDSENMDTHALLSDAHDFMNKHRLDDAQPIFQRILGFMKENQSNNEAALLDDETCMTVNQCLVGIADVYLKKGHSLRQDAFAWFHHYLASLAYMRESLHLCQKHEVGPDGWRNCDITNMRQKTEEKLDDVKDMFIRHLRRHLLLYGKDGVINEIWLENFVTYISDLFNETKSPSHGSPVKQGDISKAEKIHKKRKENKERKMDFAKIQKAISKLVRNITADIRSRYRRKKLSEETLRRSVSCEILTIMSPLTDDNDLVDLFERVIAEDEMGETEDATSPSAELDLELGSQAHSSKCSSKRGSTDSLDDGAVFMTPRGNKSRVLSPGEGPSFPCGSTISMHPEGSSNKSLPQTPKPTSVRAERDKSPTEAKPDFSIWKTYMKSPRPNSLPFKHYRLNSFDEMSPLTETSPGSTKGSESQGLEAQPEEKTTINKFLDVFPLTVTKLYETLGHMMSDLAILLTEEQRLDSAIEVYKYSLGLIHQSAKTPINNTLVAKILKNIGMIKCNKGDLVAGCQLLQEAMQLFKSATSEENMSVASVWCELGRAFLMEREHVTSLFNHVMQEVRNEMDVEWREDVLELVSEGEADDSDDSNAEDSYSVHVHEALECLQSALNVLDNLNPEEEDHGPLLIEVLTKLGDCNVVIGDYTKAVSYYEEVLTICKNFAGSTILENNAHVLCMLGVANFLLGNHPKAVTMFETASILQRHIYNEIPTFEVIFTYTMLGSAFYKMKQYHRCIVWCLKASEPSLALGDKIETLDYNRSWFLVQTFFTLGYAYYTVDFYDKGSIYLEIGQGLLAKCAKTDTKQHVKVLKVLADCFAGREDYERAMELYEDSTQLAATLGDEKSSTALQNQLLNCMASIQVNTRQYSNAASYLEQALDHQRAVETSIQGDLIGLQYKLGVTYTLSGDIDKAVDCFEECLETLHDSGSNPDGSPKSPKLPGQEAVSALGKLANLYHVKGLMQEDNEYMDELLEVANTNFTKAMNIDHHSSVCVQYANFLTMQGQPAEALEVLLPFLFSARVKTEKEVHYNGVEQAILQDHLQNETDDIDVVTMETRVLAYFLGILCFKELKLTKDADDCLELMYRQVLKSECYFSWALMGYAFMEMELYTEAAESFTKAAEVQRVGSTELPATNCSLCLFLNAYQVITKALKNITEFYVPADYIQFAHTTKLSNPQPKEEYAAPSSSTKRSSIGSHVMAEKPIYNRDSGYFETDRVPSVSSSPAYLRPGAEKRHSAQEVMLSNPYDNRRIQEKRNSAVEVSFTSSHDSSDSSYLTDQSMASDDRGYNSNECLVRMDNSLHEEDEEVWETIDAKGNIITSTIYEVENNGNYEPETTTHYETVPTTNASYRTESVSSSNDEYNANYRRLYESVQTALNEKWVNVDLLDNDTRNKLTEAGFVPPQSPKRTDTPLKPQQSSVTSQRKSYLDNIPDHYRFGSSSSKAYTHMDDGKEELCETSYVEYPQEVEEEEEEDVEEVWEVFEETVDTPPEILALLSRQSHQY